METISIKLDKTLLNNIDKSLKQNNYSTRTEFVRDALRRRLEDLRKEEILESVKNNFGKSKKKTPLWKDEVIRKIVEDKYLQ